LAHFVAGGVVLDIPLNIFLGVGGLYRQTCCAILMRFQLDLCTSVWSSTFKKILVDIYELLALPRCVSSVIITGSAGGGEEAEAP
jgi:hypothetical protein